MDERIEKYHQRKAQKTKKKRPTPQKELTPLSLKKDEGGLEKIGSSSKIHIEVRKEDNADQIKQRRKEYRKKVKEKYQINRSQVSDDDSDDSVDERKLDFYLYRQPQLNTALWETKPRAYRSIGQ